MHSVTTTEARRKFSDIVNLVGFQKEHQVVTRNGKDIVAIIPIEELRWIEEMEDRQDLEDAKLAINNIKKEGTINWIDIKKELNL